MKIRKALAGSLLATGMGVAGMVGAGTASALGLSADLNGDGQSFDVGWGATTDQSGAASGNPSLAVSIFGNASTSATGSASGNRLIAIDGRSEAGGSADNNTVVSVLGNSSVGGNSNGNTIVNVGGVTTAGGQGNDPGAVSFAVCGTSFTGQADHVTVSHGVC